MSNSAALVLLLFLAQMAGAQAASLRAGIDSQDGGVLLGSSKNIEPEYERAQDRRVESEICAIPINGQSRAPRAAVSEPSVGRAGQQVAECSWGEPADVVVGATGYRHSLTRGQSATAPAVGGLQWALRHPTELWRLFLPEPAV